MAGYSLHASIPSQNGGETRIEKAQNAMPT